MSHICCVERGKIERRTIATENMRDLLFTLDVLKEERSREELRQLRNMEDIFVTLEVLKEERSGKKH